MNSINEEFKCYSKYKLPELRFKKLQVLNTDYLNNSTVAVATYALKKTVDGRTCWKLFTKALHWFLNEASMPI